MFVASQSVSESEMLFEVIFLQFRILKDVICQSKGLNMTLFFSYNDFELKDDLDLKIRESGQLNLRSFYFRALSFYTEIVQEKAFSYTF